MTNFGGFAVISPSDDALQEQINIGDKKNNNPGLHAERMPARLYYQCFMIS